MPSAVHYVGYVEDGETPEMIMKKFEALERVRQAAVDQAKEKANENENDAPDVPQAEQEGASPSPVDETTKINVASLDENTLLEVFKQTSQFSVRMAKVRLTRARRDRA